MLASDQYVGRVSPQLANAIGPVVHAARVGRYALALGSAHERRAAECRHSASVGGLGRFHMFRKVKLGVL